MDRATTIDVGPWLVVAVFIFCALGILNAWQATAPDRAWWRDYHRRKREADLLPTEEEREARHDELWQEFEQWDAARRRIR